MLRAHDNHHDYHQETKTVIAKHFENAIDEIDAIACLLGIARQQEQHRASGQAASYGYHPDELDEIMLRRIRALSRSCQNAVSTILGNERLREPDDLLKEDALGRLGQYEGDTPSARITG